MRIFIKGGVWKNTEDEILKAAVMKYGKNQWARISSLLVRKSAKQCKARWYEWLDPSIKKTEWTREEDEKLLHLAKLMPTQWRTIAPIVGRTAAQCLDRYEKLLDQAQQREDIDEADDPRRLRPGEIDPNPEGKPARPDPIDMDEDEKEMLQEARARLANTKGKKAKRKAREKQLEEARRLASLQKRRELKAAGISLPGRRKRRKNMIDYNEEVPFEVPVPVGFYAVDESETPDPTNPDFGNLSLEDIDGKRRTDIEEAKRKDDAARQKKRRKKDAPGLAMQINKLNDPSSQRPRTSLVLPSPQMSDKDLEEIVRVGYTSEALREAAEENETTAGLLANYNTPAATPSFRTPRTPATNSDYLLKEAQNLVTLRSAQTPLEGGENTPLHESDFKGATPSHKPAATPNVHMTPHTNAGSVAGTPGRRGVSATPVRDSMGINAEGRAGQDLKSKLAALPKPQNSEFEIVMPDVPEEEKEEKEEIEEDMADVEARKAEKLAAAEAERLAARSEALKRELPRPSTINTSGLRESKNNLTAAELAEELVKEEMLTLLKADHINWPIDDGKKKKADDGKKKKKKRAVIEQFSKDELEEASKLLSEELEGMDLPTVEEYLTVRHECEGQFVFLPTESRYIRLSKASSSQQIDEQKDLLDRHRKEMMALAKRCQKAEKKINLLTGGFQARVSKLMTDISQKHDQLTEGQRALVCYRQLREQEVRAIPTRMNALTEEVNFQLEREKNLQARYKNLLIAMEDVAVAKAADADDAAAVPEGVPMES